MSALCQKQTHAAQQTTASLFDHFVGAGEEQRRDSDAECFRGFEIYHQLEFRGLLNRKIAGLRTLENLVHVLGNTQLGG